VRKSINHLYFTVSSFTLWTTNYILLLQLYLFIVWYYCHIW